MTSKTRTMILIAMLALAGCASIGQPLAGKQDSKRYELSDGSVLIVDADGRMRMFNVYSDPLYMKDGIAMKLKDGTIVAMKENVIWKQLRTRGTLNPRT